MGDAGYNKDFITAQGILDAFRDAELCAKALDASLSGRGHSTTRWLDINVSATSGAGRCTISLASSRTLRPPPPELLQLLQAVHGNQAAMDGFFARLNAGTTSPAEFFAPENTGEDLCRCGLADTRRGGFR